MIMVQIAIGMKRDLVLDPKEMAAIVPRIRVRVNVQTISSPARAVWVVVVKSRFHQLLRSKSHLVQTPVGVEKLYV